MLTPCTAPAHACLCVCGACNVQCAADGSARALNASMQGPPQPRKVRGKQGGRRLHGHLHGNGRWTGAMREHKCV